MTDSLQKPSHREWRRAVKKARRKRVRQHLATLKKALEKQKESSPTYLLELEKKRLYEEFELEKEEKEREERNLKWLQEEERAQKQWREEQRLKKLAWEEKLKEQEKIRQEWEKEQKKLKEQKEKLEALKREEERRRQEILNRINDFICNGGDIPLELQNVTESNPGKEICSFYQKVGACRFGNQCSRNHLHFQISNVLMFLNFYNHFKLDQNKSSEYDTDISLEYEDFDMNMHFREFYNDIVPEFKRFGEVTMVKVCCNTEIHLRGNVYVEYQNEREALIAYKAFQGRWYGGKQLNIEFVKIKDWGSAVCGDFVRHRCPKGNSCNFLHVFRNPRNEYFIEWAKNKNVDTEKDSYDDNCERAKNRSWRWSETPERLSNRDNSESPKENYINGKKKSSRKDDKMYKISYKKRRSRSSDKKRRSKSVERKDHRKEDHRDHRKRRSNSTEKESFKGSKRSRSHSSPNHHKSSKRKK